jgi:two-component system response regulator AlgR
LRILIVDDEANARRRLARLLAELGGEQQVIGEAADGEEALQMCHLQEVDVVLLDIEMPGMGGLETASHLAALDPPPAVIMVTAYPAYALDAFERGADDYLVKPVRGERLRSALQRVRFPTRPQRQTLAEPTVRSPRRRQLTAHYRGRLQMVPIEDVLYLQAEHKYVTVRHRSGHLLIDESLKSLEDEFPDIFLRIHRNALVARRHLAELTKNGDGTSVARLRGCEERLPVSRRHLPDVRRWLRGGAPE